MGTSEVFNYWVTVNLLTVIIIAILSIFSFKNIFNRFGILKLSRREFYECGFKPLVQKPIKLATQFIVIIIFFVIYDIELVFSFPLISYITNSLFLDFYIFMFIYGTFVLSLVYDFDRMLTKWKI